MADWVTISSLGTAGGTLILAVATYASVKESQRTSRIAERSLLVNMRPALFTTRRDDPPEKALFGDGVTLKVPGGGAAVERGESGELYFAIALRNAGAGLAVMHGWHVQPGMRFGVRAPDPDPATFRRQQRDLYVPAGDQTYWQGAIRDGSDPERAALTEAIGQPEGITIDLLYGDHEGGQRTISRFSCRPQETGEGWSANVVRHYQLDMDDPRPGDDGAGRGRAL